MDFVKDSANQTPIVDTVFAIVELAKQAKKEHGEDAVTDATIGSFYTEDGKLCCMNVVYDTLKHLDNPQMAAYAVSFTGNPDFKQDVLDWVLADHSHLYKEVIATPGGTGAVGMTIESTLDPGETLIVPEIAWGSYNLMAQMNGLKTLPYSLFKDGHFDLDSFKEACQSVMKTQKRIVAIINDPCHNPTGYSLSLDEWKSVVDFLNECSRTHPVILLNDIAYIDFARDKNEARKYFELFDDFSRNVAVVVAFSISKSMTSYGLRTGAAIILCKDEAGAKQLKTVFEKTARATWSNVNNGAMHMFSTIMEERLDEYEQERAAAAGLLEERASLFLKEAEEAGLSHYPYKEGFFVTLDMDNETRDKVHQALMDELIFTVKVNKGIRVAVCSLPLEKIHGLPARIKAVIDQCEA